ncbi:MAG: phospholipase D family protein [Acidimicrobiia bacterium]|nr:phospholipase D family protein [Acidimicrobiia bacterium]
MQYELRIQDPTNPPRNPLLAEVVEIANEGDVTWLRMFFGFLTGSGVDTLLKNTAVEKVLLHREVEVLVGLDAVTDRLGLERLLELARKNPKFKPRVIKNTTGALIHPKMLAAQYEDGRTVVVVGSNNLSRSGLEGNVEGYTIARFKSGEQVDLGDWDAFIQRWDPLIAAIDNEALKAADRNTKRLQSLGKAAKKKSKPDSRVVVSDGHAHETPVHLDEDLAELYLVAQIPKAGNRWSQVHYSADVIHKYFQVQAGDQVFLREFNSTIVEEPQVVYSSQSNMNYKIELGAARDAKYPSEGRPVVVFRREANYSAQHLYVFLMPGDQGHTEMTKLAEAAFKGRGNQVCRVIVTRSSILQAWPACPF